MTDPSPTPPSSPDPAATSASDRKTDSTAQPTTPPLPERPKSLWGGPGASANRMNPNQPIYIVSQQPGSGWFARLMSWLGWVLAAICLFVAVSYYFANRDYFDNAGGLEESYHSLSTKNTKSKIAILNASGVIMSGQGFVKQQIEQIRKDKSIKGIVLRIDSPGGTVYGSDFMYHHLVKLREERDIPMVVSMGSIAASGGYYIAMSVGDQEKCIFAEPMTTTGSIGVIIPHYNFSGLMKDYNVVDDSIMSHPRKDMLSVSREMSPDHRKIIEKYIDHAFVRFKDVIKSGRPKFEADPAALDVLATGEVFTAKQAKASGLIDEIGFIEDAIERAIEMAGLTKETTRVVRYKKPISLVDAIALGESSKPNVMKEMLELTTLRAYYLASPLPSLLSAERSE